MLDRLGWGDLSKSLNYVLRELLHNAIKANLKRIFIAENKALANEKLAIEFRNALDTQMPVLIKKLGESNMFTKLEFVNMKDAGLLIRVHNNADMRPEEVKFVDSIINASEERLGILFGHSRKGYREGVGLGLRSVMRILNKSGIGRDHLSYSTGERKTVFELRATKLM